MQLIDFSDFSGNTPLHILTSKVPADAAYVANYFGLDMNMRGNLNSTCIMQFLYSNALNRKVDSMFIPFVDPTGKHVIVNEY